MAVGTTLTDNTLLGFRQDRAFDILLVCDLRHVLVCFMVLAFFSSFFFVEDFGLRPLFFLLVADGWARILGECTVVVVPLRHSGFWSSALACLYWGSGSTILQLVPGTGYWILAMQWGFSTRQHTGLARQLGVTVSTAADGDFSAPEVCFFFEKRRICRRKGYTCLPKKERKKEKV